jgi:hypothetical protein
MSDWRIRHRDADGCDAQSMRISRDAAIVQALYLERRQHLPKPQQVSSCRAQALEIDGLKKLAQGRIGQRCECFPKDGRIASTDDRPFAVDAVSSRVTETKRHIQSAQVSLPLGAGEVHMSGCGGESSDHHFRQAEQNLRPETAIQTAGPYSTRRRMKSSSFRAGDKQSSPPIENTQWV